MVDSTQTDYSATFRQFAADGQRPMSKVGPLHGLLVVSARSRKFQPNGFMKEMLSSKQHSETCPASQRSVTTKRKYLKIAGVIRVVQPDSQLPPIQSSFYEKNLNGDPSIHLVGLCDGIGEQGWQISSRVARFMYDSIKHELAETRREAINKVSFTEMMERLIKKCVEMLKESDMNLKNNGSTCNIALIVDNLIYSSNVGDTRLMAASQYMEGITIQNLTRQHLMENQDENTRIRAAVAHYNISRRPVTKECYDIPLTRAIGCYELAHIGMTSMPEVKVFKINPYDKYLFLACQSFFRLMNEKTCLAFISEDMRKGNNLEKASDRLKFELRERQRTSSTHEEVTFILIKIALHST